jgi:hypothetical protein
MFGNGYLGDLGFELLSEPFVETVTATAGETDHQVALVHVFLD